MGETSVPQAQKLSPRPTVNKMTLIKQKQLYRGLQRQNQAPGASGRGGGGLIPEQPAWLVMAQGREVGPPPRLAPARRRLPPSLEGLLAQLLRLPIWAGASWWVLEPRPSSPGPKEELLGSGAQRLENEVHSAGPPHPSGDGDLLDDLGVAGGLSYDNVGPRRQQSPVVTIRGCEQPEHKQFSDLGSHRARGAETWGSEGHHPAGQADPGYSPASALAWSTLPTRFPGQTPIHPSKPMQDEWSGLSGRQAV